MGKSDGPDLGILIGNKAEQLPPGTTTGKFQYFQVV